jgi:4-methyl-5(b-hydroxyethyl)-thiazole monophosphate biosynthesis
MNTAPAVVVPLADGFEEVEAVAIVDVLRRAGEATAFASLGRGAVRGAHGIDVVPDCALDDLGPGPYRAVILPGGMPGSERLRDDARVLRLVTATYDAGGVVAAVCAAPIALAAAGVLRGRRAVCYPGFEDALTAAGTIVHTDRVWCDGRIVTARGAGTALEFALAVVAELRGADAARTLAEKMLVRR